MLARSLLIVLLLVPAPALARAFQITPVFEDKPLRTMDRGEVYNPRVWRGRDDSFIDTWIDTHHRHLPKRVQDIFVRITPNSADPAGTLHIVIPGLDRVVLEAITIPLPQKQYRVILHVGGAYRSSRQPQAIFYQDFDSAFHALTDRPVKLGDFPEIQFKLYFDGPFFARTVFTAPNMEMGGQWVYTRAIDLVKGTISDPLPVARTVIWQTRADPQLNGTFTADHDFLVVWAGNGATRGDFRQPRTVRYRVVGRDQHFVTEERIVGSPSALIQGYGAAVRFNDGRIGIFYRQDKRGENPRTYCDSLDGGYRPATVMEALPEDALISSANVLVPVLGDAAVSVNRLEAKGVFRAGVVTADCSYYPVGPMGRTQRDAGDLVFAGNRDLVSALYYTKDTYRPYRVFSSLFRIEEKP